MILIHQVLGRRRDGSVRAKSYHDGQRDYGDPQHHPSSARGVHLESIQQRNYKQRSDEDAGYPEQRLEAPPVLERIEPDEEPGWFRHFNAGRRRGPEGRRTEDAKDRRECREQQAVGDDLSDVYVEMRYFLYRLALFGRLEPLR